MTRTPRMPGMCLAWPGFPKIAQPPTVPAKKGNGSAHEHEPGFQTHSSARPPAVRRAYGIEFGQIGDRTDRTLWMRPDVVKTAACLLSRSHLIEGATTSP